jgi:hypothetical protein
MTVTASIALIAVLSYAFLNAVGPSLNGERLMATIIDQLSSTYQNSTFWSNANSAFHENGWTMYYYAGSTLSDNIDFYRSLPQRGFRIIILRAHTALQKETGTLAIFTSEEWDDGKASTAYLTDAMNDRIARVRVTVNSTAYFGITPNFISAMNGDFRNTIIIMMGCDGLTNTKMAEAFINKGAKAYIGWTGPVSSDHTDAATQRLLEHLIFQNQNISTAINETLAEVGDDPVYESTLSYYPFEVSEYRV